jgi:glycosyltransferase involved in cell wall biosynthesis
LSFGLAARRYEKLSMITNYDGELIDRPLVSVVVICFNQAKYIEATIRSIVSQTYAPIEVIVADDCSVDSTSEVAEEILKASGLRHLILRSTQNLGITNNSNRAFLKATGSYIAYLGGDDVWDARKVETAIAYLESEKQASMFAHGMRYIDSEGQPTGGCQTPSLKKRHIGAAEVFSGECRFLGSSAVIRRTNEVPLFDTRMPVASDLLYFVELIHKHGFAIVTPDVLGSYRVHRQSVSKTRKSQIVQDALISLSIVEARYPDLCRIAAVRRKTILYGLGVDRLKSNDRQGAVEYFSNGFFIAFHLKSIVRFFGSLFR